MLLHTGYFGVNIVRKWSLRYIASHIVKKVLNFLAFLANNALDVQENPRRSIFQRQIRLFNAQIAKRIAATVEFERVKRANEDDERFA